MSYKDCKDCYHYDVCEYHCSEEVKSWSSHCNIDDWCSTFKDKSKIIELPCKVGDTVWVVQRAYTECSSIGVKYDDVSCAGCENECDSQLTREVKEVLVDGFEINSLGLKIHLHNNWNIYLPDRRIFFSPKKKPKNDWRNWGYEKQTHN